MECSASLTDWLTAGGGVGAAVAAIVLAGLAYGQMRATKQAAARQVFPLVYAHAWKGPRARQGEVEFRYYLSNEGLGPALNVEHGIIIGEQRYAFGTEEDAFMFRSIQPGECVPPRPAGSADPVPPEPITRMVAKDELPGSTPPDEVIYWCRYETLFGEHWETTNSSDPAKSPDRNRLG